MYVCVFGSHHRSADFARALIRLLRVEILSTALCEPYNDARRNLIMALIFASRDTINEVTIFFHDRLLRACRATKVRRFRRILCVSCVVKRQWTPSPSRRNMRKRTKIMHRSTRTDSWPLIHPIRIPWPKLALPLMRMNI